MSDPENKTIRKPLPQTMQNQLGSTHMDVLDREKLDPNVKMKLVCEEMKDKSGRDPRAGGFAFVGRPRVMLQVMMDFKVGPFTNADIRLHDAVVVGSNNGDVIAWWQDIPMLIRCNVKDDKLYCLPLNQIPPSKGLDRQRAGQLRIAAHNGALERLKDS